MRILEKENSKGQHCVERVCQKLRHVQIILKNTVLIDPNRPQSSANDVEGVEYRGEYVNFDVS